MSTLNPNAARWSGGAGMVRGGEQAGGSTSSTSSAGVIDTILEPG